MRPIFSPTEYIQIKGRGTRRFTFRIGNTEYEKRNFFLVDFCAVAEYFEEKYDYSAPLRLPRQLLQKTRDETAGGPGADVTSEETPAATNEQRITREIPVWEGVDAIVSQEVRIIGPQGEKVDIMTFRGSFERDLRDFVSNYPRLRDAIDAEDDDAIETILQEQFYHRPEMFYAPDKLVLSYGIPAPSSAFVYNAMGKRPLPTREEIIDDAVDSIAARFNLRYTQQKWIAATAALVADDTTALADFMAGRYQRLFDRSQFRALGGLPTLAAFREREAVFEALRQSSLVQCATLILREAS